MTVTISDLYIYPIKSCRGVRCESAELAPTGLTGDRMLVITTPTGKMVTQRIYPRMALIAPDINGDQLTLTAPGMERLTLMVDRVAAPQPVSIWQDRCLAVDQGAEAAGWISEFLDADVRLMAYSDRFSRPVTGHDAMVSFADGYPLLLLSAAAIRELNRRLDAPVDERRFRPNIVVEGCDAHAEDDWQLFTIGSIGFENAGTCVRCSVPAIDQDTGQKGIEPNRTLAGYRQIDGAIHFGINVVQQSTGTLAVGDCLNVNGVW